MEKTIIVEVKKEDVLRGKFLKTIQQLEGVVKEAYGDMREGQNWTINKIYKDLDRIKDAFYFDLDQLCKDIKLI